MIRLLDNRFAEHSHCLCRDGDWCCLVKKADKTASKQKVFQNKKFDTVQQILQQYSGKKIKELQKKSEGNFIVFSNRDLDDSLFTIKEGTPGEIHLETGNIMGAFCLRDKETSLKIQIHSRFDESDNQFFLNYLLSKVFDVSFTELVSAKEEAVWDLLLALSFVWKFRKAAEIGLYKQYHTNEYNDLNFKGKLDLDRHIKRNYPLCDKIAYSKREITFDNPLNHLLRSAVHKIEQKWPSMLEQDRDIHKLVIALKQATPCWNCSETSKILKHKDNCSPIRHPFFAEIYEPLRRIALMLLRDEGANVFESEQMQSDQEISGVVFDGSWLWEEYIATVLTDFRHAVYPTVGGIHVFADNNLKFYPDFWSESQKIVLDTKYKRSASTGQREDIHQVLCYMFLTGATRGGLIYPPGEKDADVNKKLKINVNNNNAYWENFSFKEINEADRSDANSFVKYMKEQEKALQMFAKKEIVSGNF